MVLERLDVGRLRVCRQRWTPIDDIRDLLVLSYAV